MSFFPKIKFPFFTRNILGNVFYDSSSYGDWSLLGGTNIQIAENHPILSPAILFIAKLYSQADYYILNTRTNKKIDKHWLLDLINNPNYYQTKTDFFESQMFTQIAEGKAVGYLKRTTGLKEPSAIYLLNPNLIEYPDDFVTNMTARNEDNPIKKKKIIYDKDGENLTIAFDDLLFFYDMPNGLQENFFETKSRIDGLKQTLLNTKDSLIAKNIILKTNGKELITTKGGAGKFPLNTDDKAEAEKLFQNNYGLGFNRKRGLVTASDLSHKSLHIALRDLGLDESVKVDGNIIYTALHIPKDILSLEAKKTTYNNFKESMTSYIQNEMQPSIDATCQVFQRLLKEKNLKLVGTFEHLPIMKHVLREAYLAIEQRGKALYSLRSAGLPDDIALEECGYEPTIELNELTETNDETEQSSETNAGAEQD